MKRQLHQPGPISALKMALQYEFQDLELLRVALTHASALAPSETVSGSYQRLEFLGDRVLGLVIASMLHKHFPKADEGELARRFNHMVKRETCAEIAQELGVGDAMRIGLAEAQTGAGRKPPCSPIFASRSLPRFTWTAGLRQPKASLRAFGSRVCYPGRVHCATPRQRCRNGHNRRACRHRDMM